MNDPSSGMDDAAVLADPADARVAREHPLLHRTRVDVVDRVERLVGLRRASTRTSARAAAR
ncbi:MAG: hypothetical protein QM736_01260 [Vicinamibacterales bacterium]